MRQERSQERCEKCRGTGVSRCLTCRGTGRLPESEIARIRGIKRDCPNCNGSGKITCPACKGEGIRKVEILW